MFQMNNQLIPHSVGKGAMILETQQPERHTFPLLKEIGQIDALRRGPAFREENHQVSGTDHSQVAVHRRICMQKSGVQPNRQQRPDKLVADRHVLPQS